MKKKIVLIVLSGMLLTSIVLTACKGRTGQVAVEKETEAAASSKGEEVSATEDFSAEDFSMPKPKFDPTKYEDLLARAEQMGYDLPEIESFSNGYTFREFSAMGDDKLTITYSIPNEEDFRNDLVVTFSITPKGEKNYEADPIQKQEDVQIQGVDIVTYLYIHLVMPSNYEELLTDEQRQLLEDGRAGGGVSPETGTEIIRKDKYTIMWQEKNYEVCLKNEYCMDYGVTKEELDIIAEEWITTSQK